MHAFLRRFLMKYGIYRRYPPGAAARPAQCMALCPRLTYQAQGRRREDHVGGASQAEDHGDLWMAELSCATTASEHRGRGDRACRHNGLERSERSLGARCGARTIGSCDRKCREGKCVSRPRRSVELGAVRRARLKQDRAGP
jgi:hypothetical protein